MGFALNPVAEVYGSYNGQNDSTLSDYHAQINWGDGPSWDASTQLAPDPSTGYIIVKGSHNYQKMGTYDITVYITGPDGQTISDEPGTVTVVPMPDEDS